MKLDYDLIKEILEKIESGDGASIKTIWHKDFKDSDERKQEYLRLRYHYKILFDNKLADGEVYELPHKNYDGGGDDMILINFSYKALTLKGHETLEAMQNDTVWNKIKGSVKQAGITGVKQIPALALTWLMSQ